MDRFLAAAAVVVLVLETRPIRTPNGAVAAAGRATRVVVAAMDRLRLRTAGRVEVKAARVPVVLRPRETVALGGRGVNPGTAAETISRTPMVGRVAHRGMPSNSTGT